jgi:ATP-dependent Clp protease ATP-binding subunit ClpC
MLARGELQTIGATTIDEYRKHLEKDAALERRFQPITVEEPSVAHTDRDPQGPARPLRGAPPRHDHRRRAGRRGNLADRYISDRFLPDKAIDLIDEAGSRLRIRRLTAPPDLQDLEEEAQRVRKAKESAIDDQDFEKAAQLRDQEKKLLERKAAREKEWKSDGMDTVLTLDEEEIAEVLSNWTGIPVFKLTEEETAKLLRMEAELHKRIVGQEDAISAVSKSIRRTRSGLKDPKRPAGSFIFLGPSGVGKTELAKTLAEFLFGDEDALIHLDMSEYMEKHTVSRLIGSPSRLRRLRGGRPAHRGGPPPAVQRGAVRRGREGPPGRVQRPPADPRGRSPDRRAGQAVDFKNTVLIMTSNLGTRNLGQQAMGFAAKADERDTYARMKEQVDEELKRTSAPSSSTASTRRSSSTSSPASRSRTSSTS